MHNKKGLTLMELCVTVIIVGVMASFGIISYRKTIERSRIHNGITLLNALYAIAKIYRSQEGSFYQSIGWLSLDSFNTEHDSHITIPNDAFFYYTTSGSPPGGFEMGYILDEGEPDEIRIRAYGTNLTTDNPCCHAGPCTSVLPSCS